MNSTSPTDSIKDISVEYGMIRFPSYLEYKLKAVQARDYLKNLEVTPETEQECKRTVAAARKIADQLNDAKIRAKKTVLMPYMAFEDQVKEIIGIITEGEDVARDKLRMIDNLRREEKKALIREIWDKRAGSFEIGNYFCFEDFLEDKHLNKTAPISQTEGEMVVFLTQAETDLRFLLAKPRGAEYAEEYKKCRSIPKAMETVDRRYESIKANSQDPYMVIRITGKADVILAKQLLKDVNYKVLEEN